MVKVEQKSNRFSVEVKKNLPAGSINSVMIAAVTSDEGSRKLMFATLCKAPLNRAVFHLCFSEAASCMFEILTITVTGCVLQKKVKN